MVEKKEQEEVVFEEKEEPVIEIKENEPGKSEPEKNENEKSESENPKDNDETDEIGVSWKNRYMESQRRLSELQTRNSIPTPEVNYEEEESRTGVDRATLSVIDERARRIAEEIRNEEEKASLVFDTTIANLANTYPSMERFKGKIREKMSNFKLSARCNGALIEEIAFSVLGREVGSNPPKKENPRQVIKSSVIDSRGGSGGRESVNLSPEELRFATDHELYEKGFEDTEIKALYQKKNKK